MFSDKFTLCTLLVSLVGMVLVQGYGETTVGERILGDYMIGSEVVWVPSRISRVVETNRTFFGLNGSVISYAKITDKSISATSGATVNVTKGKAGDTSITVQFISEKGYEIYNLVELYGKIERC